MKTDERLNGNHICTSANKSPITDWFIVICTTDRAKFQSIIKANIEDNKKGMERVQRIIDVTKSPI